MGKFLGLPGCNAKMDDSTPRSGSKMGNGTNPPDLTYLAYWSIVPGPVQLTPPTWELAFLDLFKDIGLELKLMEEVLPETSSLLSLLLPVENFFPRCFSFGLGGTEIQ